MEGSISVHLMSQRDVLLQTNTVQSVLSMFQPWYVSALVCFSSTDSSKGLGETDIANGTIGL